MLLPAATAARAAARSSLARARMPLPAATAARAAASSLAHAGVRALLPHISSRRVLRFADIIARRVADTVLVLENLSDARNVSACLRTADALGVAHVVLVERWGSVGAPVPGVDKGCGKWLDVRRFASAAAAAAHVRGELGAALYATALTPAALPLGAAVAASLATAAGGVRLRPRIALCFGNEHRGVSGEMRALSDALFYIPQAGFVESMNVSVAAAVACSAFMRRTPDYERALVAGRGAGLVVETAPAALAGSAPRSDAALLAMIAAARGPPAQEQAAPPADGGGDGAAQLCVERLSGARQDELLLAMLLTSVPNAERILERKGVRPADL